MRLGREPRRSTCHGGEVTQGVGPILAWVDWIWRRRPRQDQLGADLGVRMDSVRPTASSNSPSATTRRMRCWMGVLGMPALTP